MNASHQGLFDKIMQLAQQDRTEVEHFIDFLLTHGTGQRRISAACQASEPVFVQIWDNDEDAAYDQ